MYTTNAIEAVYIYIGLGLQSRFIEVMTSSPMFKAIILLMFFYLFVLTTVRFFSRYLPGNILSRSGVPVSRFFTLILGLTVAMSLLKVTTNPRVSDYDGKSWQNNRYVQEKLPQASGGYRVSVVFDIICQVSEEMFSGLNQIIDQTIGLGHSQLRAPNLIYKAVALAGTEAVASPELKYKLTRYTEDCLSEVLTTKRDQIDAKMMDGAFASGRTDIDHILKQIPLSQDGRETCYDLRLDVLDDLSKEARAIRNSPAVHRASDLLVDDKQRLLNESQFASNIIVNHYLDQTEGRLGVDKLAELPTTGGRIAQYLVRITNSPLASVMSLFGEKNRGLFMAAERAEELAQNMSRAPHVAGFIKMILFALFPWLVFPVLLGYWKAIIWWIKIYLSVLLWVPCWTVLYSVMTGITIAATDLANLDHVNLLSTTLINEKLNFGFAVYSWLQLLLGIGITGGVLKMAVPFAQDTKSESAGFVKEAMGDASTIATTFQGTRQASSAVKGAAGFIARKIATKGLG